MHTDFFSIAIKLADEGAVSSAHDAMRLPFSQFLVWSATVDNKIDKRIQAHRNARK